MGSKPTKIERQLIEAIRASGLTQEDLAKLSGVDQGAISRFLTADLKARRSLSLPTADKLCRLLGMELVQVQKPKPPKPAKGRKEK